MMFKMATQMTYQIMRKKNNKAKKDLFSSQNAFLYLIVSCAVEASGVPDHCPGQRTPSEFPLPTWRGCWGERIMHDITPPCLVPGEFARHLFLPVRYTTV